ncbi:hypothetical protein JK635_02265 [Neobacillus sp. YIM B02564]|uniref:Single-stranded DNA-binding protein n=1 Tax=Neobacillus paridis TaxID=2803862 RepID=A0ABS1TJ50_9BACI|nr:hypothetical protein [Neobacillus paridis]MBL4951064.1 hypothetical protein [Neobacillus paridis]
MVNTFEIIGKLSISKETEKFKPYESQSFPSGWAKSRLLFNVQSAENRHMLTIEGMYKEDGTGLVYTFTKGTIDQKTNEKIKGENIQIPWKDRNKPENIEKVAEFKKYIIDLEQYGRRYKLENAIKKQVEGTITDEELNELGLSAEELQYELEQSKKKRKEFLTEYDFTEFLHKLLLSDKLKDKVFKVLGNIIHSEYNGKIYKKLVPTRIYLVPSDTEQTSTGNITIFFNKDSLDTRSYESSKKYYINGFVRDYDSQRKENIPCPVQLVIDDTSKDEKKSKIVNVIKKQFEVDDDSWKEFGVKVKILDGAQKVDITEDMLTDFQKEMLELGAIDMDDIRKEIGGDIYGERVQEMVIVNVSRGYTKGRKDTVFLDSDFVVKPIEPEQETKEESIADNVDLDDLSDLDDLF